VERVGVASTIGVYGGITAGAAARGTAPDLSSLRFPVYAEDSIDVYAEDSIDLCYVKDANYGQPGRWRSPAPVRSLPRFVGGDADRGHRARENQRSWRLFRDIWRLSHN
jgi:hypothetical protein